MWQHATIAVIAALFIHVGPTQATFRNNTSLQFIKDVITHHTVGSNSVLARQGNARSLFQKWHSLESDLIGFIKYKIKKSNRNEHERKVEETDSLGCKTNPSLRILKFLGRICEDCYSIYRDADVFQLCR